MVLTESRDASVKRFDALGAVLVTGGLVTLVYAITQATDNGWGSRRDDPALRGSAALLALLRLLGARARSR